MYKNKETRNKYERELRKRSPRIRIKEVKNKARRRNEIFDYDYDKFVAWYTDQKEECYYCGRNVDNKLELQIDRMINDKGYVVGNIVLSCKVCNSLKSSVFTSEEWLEIARKYKIRFRDF